MKYRSIFVSDIHLGTSISKVGEFLDFIKDNQAEQIYLLGDIIDLISLKRKVYWRQEHNTAIQKLLRLARKGTRIIYIPGNHDFYFRDFIGENFGNIRIEGESIHQTADGRRFIVVHGDEFDGAIRNLPWLYWLGDKAYHFALLLNRAYNAVTHCFGLRYWSLSLFLKNRVKNAVIFISDYEKLVIDKALQRGVDGIIAGHIHKADLKELDGVLYANCGCWTEFCSAIVEHTDGRLELVDVMGAQQTSSSRTVSQQSARAAVSSARKAENTSLQSGL